MKRQYIFGLFALFLVLFLSCGERNPRVLIQTELGDIQVELKEKEAPITVRNFLSYVDEGVYDNAVFYRVVTLQNQPVNPVKIEVIQGGLFAEEKMKSPIHHETTEETGILHENGVISMARLDPGSASSEFFICIGDQPELDFGGKRNPDGQGFAAFGRVVKGMAVVKSIQTQPSQNQALTPHITIKKMRRL